MKLVASFMWLLVIGCSSVDDEFKSQDCQKRVVYQLKEKCEFEVGQKVYYIENVIGEVTNVSDNQFTLCLLDTLLVRTLIDARALDVEISTNEFVKVFPLKGLMNITNGEQIKAIIWSSQESSGGFILENNLKNKMESLLNNADKAVRSLDTINFDRKASDATFNKLSETLDSLSLKSK